MAAIQYFMLLFVIVFLLLRRGSGLLRRGLDRWQRLLSEVEYGVDARITVDIVEVFEIFISTFLYKLTVS
jgi:hypothetical protein